MLLIDQLSVELAGVQVLRRIHAHVLTGSTVAVIGRNGAGKTTLLRSIMGLVPVSGGSVLFDKSELLNKPAHQRAALGIGYAPEDRIIFPTLSVLQNLRLPAEVLGLSAADLDLRLQSVLEVVPQLEPMLARSGAALSGGQGKMVALGRALMAGSRLVLLDRLIADMKATGQCWFATHAEVAAWCRDHAASNPK